MLISNRHGFLFVHIAGTGGTTVRAALEQVQGKLWERWSRQLYKSLRLILSQQVTCELPVHAPIVVARELLPADVFVKLFKFAFVRNPWDRLLGAYMYYRVHQQELLAQHSIDSFERFVDHVCSRDPSRPERNSLGRAIERCQLESLIGLRGELLVDYVGRYEQLCYDLHAIGTRLSLPIATRFDAPPTMSDYRSRYSDALAERVAKHYADDLAAFQYQFDPSSTTNRSHGDRDLRVDAIAGRIHR